VFENRVPRGTFGPEGEQVMGGWGRLHNEEHHSLYALRNIIRVMKSRRTRWAGHVTCMGEMRNAYKTLVENLKERIHSEDLYVNGRKLLE
jgi:hypothetical protein